MHQQIDRTTLKPRLGNLWAIGAGTSARFGAEDNAG
jgi:hypothetical protein